jgi:hypothetical protein
MTDDVIYLSMPLRNVGAGLAVLQGWHPWPDRAHAGDERPGPDQFRRQTRDLYVPPGDVGFWQGAIRTRDDEGFAVLQTLITSRRAFTVDLLYSDHEGGQRTISRFGLIPRENDGGWICSVTRHWNLDRADPR